MLALCALLLFDYSAEGLKALEARQYEAAVEHFTKAAAVDPRDYAAQFHLGLSYSLLDRDAEAAAAYRKTLELKPGLYQAELNLAIVLLRSKQPAASIPLLESAAQKKPAEFRPRFYLAEALYAAGDPGRAAAGYRAALDLDEKSAAAHLGLARALVKQQRPADAQPHFRRAADLDPSYKDALLELAAQLETAGRPDEAISIYEQFPDNAAAQERLGELLIEAKRYADAIPRLEKAVARDPTPANQLALATAYRMSQQLDKAVPLLDRAAAADPSSFGLRMHYGRALRDQRRFQPAAEQFHRAIRLQPDSREAWNELAGMLILLESYPQALAALDRARALGEDTATNHYFRAITLDKLQQYEPALASYEKFLSLSGNQNPDEEFKARQRMRIIRKELSKR
ncbi:MAG: tetratricopeptide repeat protein [Acidobacteria bacterium]|nr:tetratricopeptide repeat protein [Acidobacteriota bacterium]